MYISRVEARFPVPCSCVRQAAVLPCRQTFTGCTVRPPPLPDGKKNNAGQERPNCRHEKEAFFYRQRSLFYARNKACLHCKEALFADTALWRDVFSAFHSPPYGGGTLCVSSCFHNLLITLLITHTTTHRFSTQRKNRASGS